MDFRTLEDFLSSFRQREDLGGGEMKVRVVFIVFFHTGKNDGLLGFVFFQFLIVPLPSTLPATKTTSPTLSVLDTGYPSGMRMV